MPRVIVIGAGSAGCVVAGRLSEDPELDMLLLEAGPDVRSGDESAAVRGPNFLDAVAEPGRAWPDLVAQRARGQLPRTYVRGRGVGGCSAVNAMVALAGEPEDYDRWARDHGCTGWSWADVAPWFERTALALHRAPRREWAQVNRALGAAVPESADGVRLTRDGEGRRVSANDAYLEPARGRANLVVRGDAHVDRILFEGRRASGVRLASGDELECDEVVVSAGAIHSPAILLRSGVDTPGVGEGLQDHASFPLGIRVHEPAAAGTLAIATTSIMSSSIGHHDLQLLPIDHVDAAFPELALLMAAVMDVRSRGRVRLASDPGLADDPLTDPVVEFDMLTDDRDVTLMLEAIALADRALDHSALRAVGDPIPVDHSLDSIRGGLGDYVHAAGTCAMGRVVDTAGRLLGYEGVVVCDASVMPQLPRANTHLPTVMLAERIASGLRASFVASARTR